MGLPVELLGKVFDFLSQGELCLAGMTCSTWSILSSDRNRWQWIDVDVKNWPFWRKAQQDAREEARVAKHGFCWWNLVLDTVEPWGRIYSESTDQDVQDVVTRVPFIQQLRVHSKHLSNETLRHLSRGGQNLRSLWLGMMGEAIRDQAFVSMASQTPFLARFHLRVKHLTTSLVREISRWPNLETLELNALSLDPEVSSALCEVFSRCAFLTELSLPTLDDHILDTIMLHDLRISKFEAFRITRSRLSQSKLDEFAHRYRNAHLTFDDAYSDNYGQAELKFR